MIIRGVQLLAFTLISAPLLYSVSSFDTFTATRRSDNLSNRATEFITTQKETGKSLWNDVSLQTPPSNTAILGTQQYQTPCFELTIPWPHVLEPGVENLESCVLKVRLTTPRGRLVIHAASTSEALKDQTAIRIRFHQPEQFTEVVAPQTNWPESIQFTEPDATTLFLSSTQWTISLAATEISDPDVFSFEPLLSTLEMRTESVLQL
ncbi:hypothetical protein KBD71_01540 [Candidatus Woesebacteria bacterium]|nr:hypothetical protein [Candidatus Woesebacteria bacterium]